MGYLRLANVQLSQSYEKFRELRLFYYASVGNGISDKKLR
jgi:hypothetical protein